MPIFGGLLGAKVGAVVGTALLGPVGTVVGAKLGALIGSGGNPMSLIGADVIDADLGGTNGGPDPGEGYTPKPGNGGGDGGLGW